MATNQLLVFSVDPISGRLFGAHNMPSGKGHVLRLALFDLSDNRLIGVGGGPASEVAIAPGGEQGAIVGQDGQVSIIDLASGAVLRHIVANNNSVDQIAWSADGKRVATGTAAIGFGLDRATGKYGPLVDKNLLQLWDAKTGQQIASATQIEDGVASIDFSRDGRWMAVADTHGDVHLFEPNGLRYIGKAASEKEPMTVRVRFSPNSKKLARLRTRATSITIDQLDTAP